MVLMLTHHVAFAGLSAQSAAARARLLAQAKLQAGAGSDAPFLPLLACPAPEQPFAVWFC